jgi:hypothetical protein
MCRLLFILLLFCLLATGMSTAFAANVELPQSRQTQCYDTSGNIIACAGTGQDGAMRMGASWPDPRFSVNGDCVTDNLTGLIWVKSPDSTTRTWQAAIDYAKGLSLCGVADWRVPSINELRSLAHSGYNEETCGGAPCVYMSDWLNSKGFSNVQSDGYWSSTTFAGSTVDAWGVNMWYGLVSYGVKADIYYVWPVRGGQ